MDAQCLYVCATKGTLQRAGTGQSSAVNLLQQIPRLQDSLTSFSMTSVASQTHPSQPFCYPGSPPCPPWGFWVHWAVSYLHCLAFLQDVAQTPCILGSLPFPDLCFLSCLPHVLKVSAIALMFSV